MKLPDSNSITEFASLHWLGLVAFQAVILLGLGFLVGGGFTGSTGAGEKAEVQADDGADDAEVAAVWTCSMHPQIRKNGPGSCPICGMDLVPVKTSKGQMTGMRQISVSPAARALMNIQSVPAERRYVKAEVRMVGKVDYDETRYKYITAWVSGRLDRLFVDYSGVEVKKGDHMIYMYSEELYTAQQELIEALKSVRARNGKESFFNTGGVSLLESAREKLRLWGMTAEQIADVEKRDKPSDHMTIYSPMGGIVIEKLRQEGDRVRTGDRIYTVADLSQVWVKMDAYESDLIWLRYGQQVEFSTEAYPGEVFSGRIAFIDPVLNEKTRTVKIRVNVPNAQGKLKPEMFVRALVKAKIAAGGRVIDENLKGKWISPMHPEIIKDKPGVCDICGMPLVRAESMNYVVAESAGVSKPLVIPVSAALVTGTRAVVYVEMPPKPKGLEAAYRQLAEMLEQKHLDHLKALFGDFYQLVSNPHTELRTASSKRLWNTLAVKLAEDAKLGRKVKKLDAAQDVFNRLTKTMDEVREHFANSAEPTFEGREILLGPRAGDYYLVKNGLQEGELVVTRGNFKIDSEIQIQAKPSMMTPDGGGGGGGHHHGGGTKKKKGGAAMSQMDLPLGVQQKLQALNTAYKEVVSAVKTKKISQIHEKYSALRTTLAGIDASALSAHQKMVWKELSMLLANDVVEGGDVSQPADVQRVFASLTNNFARLDKQFGLSHGSHVPQRLDVSDEFQLQLARVWKVYLSVGEALAADNLDKSKQAVVSLERSLSKVDMKLLKSASAHKTWMQELSNLQIITGKMKTAADIKVMRGNFKALSGVASVLAISFGFGESVPVYQLHCPMAFGNKGAIWLQTDDQTRNPYFGNTMLKCADRVELISGKSAKKVVPKE